MAKNKVLIRKNKILNPLEIPQYFFIGKDLLARSISKSVFNISKKSHT